MKRIIVALSLMLMATSVTAGNRFILPTDNKDNPLQGDGYAGASATVVTTVDGTEQVVFAGAGVVYGIVLSSGVTTSFAVLSDSGTVASPTGAVTGSLIYAGTNVTFTFPQGIRVSDGATLAITGASPETATVFYLDEQP